MMKIEEVLAKFKNTHTYVSVGDLMACVEETFRIQENQVAQ